jgi:3-oxoacyl-[acyl-carrier-protein] synthase II
LRDPVSDMRGDRLTHHRTPRVVVTGLGLITPFACGREASWQRILAGETATRLVNGVVGAPLPPVVDSAHDPVVELAVRCAEEAVTDAGLRLGDVDRDRVGCVIGTSKPLLRTFARHRRTESASREHERPEFSRGIRPPARPYRLTDVFPNQPSLAVSRRFQLAGPSLCPVAACATGLVCLQRGYELIRDGCCDSVLAGSSDASLLPIVLGSFKRLGVLARNVDDPAAACRPFDRERSGFVIGEGAAVLVLERLEDAAARGANVYAEWLTGGTAADATSLTGLDMSGEPLARLIGDVLHRGGIRPAELDYVNLHGTATEQNDVYETRAVKRALTGAASSLSCSGIKGAIGHLLGAAGSVETAATLLAIRDGVVPPTVNLTTPDPECDLDYTPLHALRKPVRTALKLSLGFGGHLAAAVVRRIV